MKAMETSPGGTRAVRPRIGVGFRVGKLTVESPTERRKGGHTGEQRPGGGAERRDRISGS